MNTLRGVFDYSKLFAEIKELEKQEWSIEQGRSLARKTELLNTYNGIKDDLDFFSEFFEEASESELKELVKRSEDFAVKLMLNGKYDLNNAIITIHAGAGGEESEDWAKMLGRMYTMFSQKNGYKIVELDDLTYKISGDYAYGYLKAEKGVHRLVRISPFDSAKRRHTSFASVDVMPEIEMDNTVVIDAKDLRIDTYRSGGSGGQHVNKTESACRITHLPTGLVATCQNERSLIQNKEQAMKVLASKLALLKEEENKSEQKKLAGEKQKNEWGSQIRSYVFCPYTLVKDARTNHEETNVEKVMDGEIREFMVKWLQGGEKNQ